MPITKYTVKWTDIAKKDLTGIIEYIAEDNKTNAKNILKKIRKKADDLKTFPHRGKIPPEFKYHNMEHYREIIYDPWRIFYIIENDSVYIISVIDGRRNVEDILLHRFMEKISLM